MIILHLSGLEAAKPVVAVRDKMAPDDDRRQVLKPNGAACEACDKQAVAVFTGLGHLTAEISIGNIVEEPQGA